VASPSVDAIETALAGEGFYLDEGVEAAPTEMRELVDRYPGFYFVALSEEVEEGGEDLADAMVTALGGGTVVVLSPDEASAVSSVFDDDAMAGAFSEAQFGGSYVEDFAAFATALTGSASTPGAGISWTAVLLGLGLVGLVGFLVWRGSRRSRQVAENRLGEARTEIREQMDVIASQILELADDARLAANPEAEDHYRQAADTYQQAETRLAEAATEPALEALSDDLDHARWQLEAAGALIAGKALPPAPQPDAPLACFFDPTHGAGREQATIETAAGSKVVMVCEADAEKLRRGENPDPRQIPYDHRRVPAPQAPRSHGGLGMDWLDVFSVIVGGMGSGRGYDWSGTRGPRRRGGFRVPGQGRSRGSTSRRGAGTRSRR